MTTHLARAAPLCDRYGYHRPGFINFNNGYHDNMYDNYGRYDSYYQSPYTNRYGRGGYGMYGQRRLARITGFGGQSRDEQLQCIEALEREGFQVARSGTGTLSDVNTANYRWNASQRRLELEGSDRTGPKYIPIWGYGSNRGYYDNYYYNDRSYGRNRGGSYGYYGGYGYGGPRQDVWPYNQNRRRYYDY